ncbi:MAG: hypothetical protein ACJA2W_002976 [Planctomycetota bacterium]|jgi:hypothetical protein
MTPTPLPSDAEPEFGSADSPRQESLAPATVETLVRFDEASDHELAQLDRDPRSREVLRKLRVADRYLQRGQLLAQDPKGTGTVAAETLFDFGHGDLQASEAEAVREHLAGAPEEDTWVESLRQSPPPATLTWETLEGSEDDANDVIDEEPDAQPTTAPEMVPAVESPVLAGPGSNSTSSRRAIPGWVAWTPLAAAALILAMALGGNGRRSVLEGGLPSSPIVRSASTEALLFPRGRVIASTSAVTTYASQPLFEVTPVADATRYGFELRDVSNESAFAEGEIVWESTSTEHHATAPALQAGSYVWRATARVQGMDRDLGSRSFTVVRATAVDRSLLLRAASSQHSTMPGILREDIRRLHASGFLTDARGKARALPPGQERDEYLAIQSGR